MNEITRTVTRFWVVCEGTYTTHCTTEDEARAKANQMMCAGIDVLRIEKQTVTTTTSIIEKF